MSKFKDVVLDFNIFAEPTRRPRRTSSSVSSTGLTLTPLPAAAPTPKEPPTSVDSAAAARKKQAVAKVSAQKTAKPSAEKTAKRRRRRKCTKRRCRVSRRRLLVLALVALVFACLWLPSLLFDHAHFAPEKHTLSHCVRHKSSVSCQNKACSGFRGTCASGRVVVFDSDDCADKIQTMHVEHADGRVERLPAQYFRVENSSMFVFHGKRVSFQPAACAGNVESAVVHPGKVESRLHGHVVWTHRLDSGGDRFKIYEKGDTRLLVAELDGAFVRTKCNTDHCVYQFPIHCNSVDPSAIEVYCEHQDKKDTLVSSFVFCAA